MLHSLKKEEINEDDYEEIQPDFKCDNLVFLDTKKEQIDVLSEFCSNVDSFLKIKNNIRQNFNIKTEKNSQNLEKSKIRIEENNEYSSNDKIINNPLLQKHSTIITDVVDDIQEEVDNFKITNFLNEDSKFKVNLDDSDHIETNNKNDDSEDSTVENGEIEEEITENNEEEDDEFNEEVKVINNDNLDNKKEEQIKRIKECVENIDLYRNKCVGSIGENRFNQLYNHYYSLNDVNFKLN